MPDHTEPATRLYVSDTLAAGTIVPLSESQAHQLRAVLRLETGATVALFNGRDGEWHGPATIEKRRAHIVPTRQARLQGPAADIWLAFAPIKHERMAFLIEKATELGVARLLPVITARTQAARVNVEKLANAAREAAEQCERLDVPEIDPPQSLDALLKGWDKARTLYAGFESGAADTVASAFGTGTPPAAILIGPEGGFTAAEFTLLRAQGFVRPVSLGPLILRAETAAVAALACWQAQRHAGPVT